MNKSLLLTFTHILFVLSLSAQSKNMSKEEYISSFAKWAVLEMYEYGVPASITIAQGILESGSGNSDLAKNANNHFGIKCHKGWEGLKYYMDDDTIQECFRVYPTVLESYRDHSLFLRTRSRYAGLFELDRTDYVGWAKGLKAAGYATNPKYPEMLIISIEDYDLYQYDTYPDPRPANVASKTPKTSPRDTIVAIPVVEELFTINNRKCVKIGKGFSVAELSLKHNVSINKLYKYNDIVSEEMLDTGMYFFIEKKQNEGQEEFHIVKEGESMFQVAQIYGIKLQKLYDLNKMEKYLQPMIGERINLKKERDSMPLCRTYYEVIQERNNMIEKNKQIELRRRTGIEKATVEQRYRLQIEQLKAKNNEDEIKLAEMEFQINKLKKEQEKFIKDKANRIQQIQNLEKENNTPPPANNDTYEKIPSDDGMGNPVRIDFENFKDPNQVKTDNGSKPTYINTQKVDLNKNVTIDQDENAPKPVYIDTKKLNFNKDATIDDHESIEDKRNKPVYINTGNPNMSDQNYKPMTWENEKTGMVNHVVSQGETLFSIARKYGVTVAEIRETNGMDSEATIKIGQQLMIQKKK